MKRFLNINGNGYFQYEDGEVFLPIGGFYGNFVHRVKDGEVTDEIISSIRGSSDDEKRAWFKVLAANGVNCLRIMSRDHAAEGVDEWDIAGALNEPLMKDWEHYWELAAEYGVHILPTIHESFYADYSPYRNREVMDRMVMPHYTPEAIAALPEYRRNVLTGPAVNDENRMLMYNSPDLTRTREDYVAALIPRLEPNPSILFYELENEQEVGIYDWTNKNIAWIRQRDKKTPICISHSGAGLMTADPLPHSKRTGINFYSYHIYPVDRVCTPELDYGMAVSMLARYAMLGVPAGVGESGSHILANGPTGAWRRALARDTIWFSFLAGNNHLMFWDAGQAETIACKDVTEAARLMDLRTFKRKTPRIAVDVTHPLDDDIYFRSEEGYALYQNMGRYEDWFASAGVDFAYVFEENAGKYPIVLYGEDFEPYTPAERVFELSRGYQLRHMTASDDSRIVAYIRNRGENIRTGAGWHTGYLRRPTATPFNVKMNLPGNYEGFLHCFETGQRTPLKVDGSGVLGSGAVDENDYWLFLRKV